MAAPTVAVSFADLLYLLCSLLLLGSAGLVLSRGPKLALHRLYALTALSLLGWVATLALYYHSSDPFTVLWLGRANFAAAALAVSFGYLLVRALAGRRPATPAYLAVESLALAALSLLSPWVDRAELAGVGPGGRHVTVYGPLFLLYALHVLGYLGASAAVAFQARRDEARGAARDRLTLVGIGVLATGAVGVTADIVMPYGFGDFRFTDAGPLSTAFFLLAVGYAVVRHQLFDVRVFVRRTLVLGLLLSLATAAYGAVVTLATERLAGGGAGTLTRFSVLVIALSFDPLRRTLEKRADRLLARK